MAESAQAASLAQASGRLDGAPQRHTVPKEPRSTSSVEGHIEHVHMGFYNGFMPRPYGGPDTASMFFCQTRNIVSSSEGDVLKVHVTHNLQVVSQPYSTGPAG